MKTIIEGILLLGMTISVISANIEASHRNYDKACYSMSMSIFVLIVFHNL